MTLKTLLGMTLIDDQKMLSFFSLKKRVCGQVSTIKKEISNKDDDLFYQFDNIFKRVTRCWKPTLPDQIHDTSLEKM